MTIEEILKTALAKGATDVHLKAGVMPIIRRHGVLRPLAPDAKPLSGEQVEKIAKAMMTEMQNAAFDRAHEMDLGYGITGLGRFRVSIFRQRGTVRIVIRNIPFKVPTIKELGLPSIVEKIAQLERGLVLITGVTGSGKSSTLAAIIDDINSRDNKHILTIEDPIEFLIRDRKSLITQREIGIDTRSFASALRAGLRQDPDVILIGEMRDRETIETALHAAETGHLILSTLHTLDATETINRIIAVFENEQQKQMRLQLGSVLKAVISQRLCRRKDNSGVIPAVEVMFNTPRVRELIEDPAETQQIQEAIEQGQAAWGMQSFDQSLMELVNHDLVTFEEALQHCARPEDFRIRFEGITSMDGKKWSETDVHANRMDDNWGNLTEVELVMPIEEEPEEKPSGKKKKNGSESA